MKTNQKSDEWQVTRDGRAGSARGAHSCHPSPVTRHSRRGMALVITLILLSVTLVMAVAFLAVARRERNAVTITTNTTQARLAAEAALAAAQAQIVANIFATTNVAAYDYHLLVSTNYINYNGFVAGSSNPTNVYYYDPAGNLLTGNNYLQNIANLLFLPRPPVFIKTNLTPYGYDFRYFLDLNRNGRHEPNGWVTNYDAFGNVMLDASGNVVANFQVGDPEWIGVLERPDAPHSANNKFLSRYAFVAQPIGNSLDLNYLHNQARSQALNFGNDGYFRNQGVGSWELNLAAFLTDLNTNVWAPFPLPDNAYYSYNQPGNINRGIAFNDALSLLAYRYNYTYNTLAIPSANIISGLVNGGLDGYTMGNLMTNTTLPVVLIPTAKNWPGSDNTNHYFTPGDLFGSAINLGTFPTHLRTAGSGTSTYDRYTFYRMLDQLGTDSSADSGKLNLNYSNAVVQYDFNTGVVTNLAIIAGAETNLVPWRPLDFFHAAADQLLRTYTAQWLAQDRRQNTNYVYDYTNTFGATTTAPFGVTNIPVYVNGKFVYSPAVNRLLQLAANIYDASTNSPFPSVFRPVFNRVIANGYNNIYITSYEWVYDSTVHAYPASPIQYSAAQIPLDVEVLAASGGTPPFHENVFGVPWIIGAKKGLPNFNQLSMVNSAQVTRKLMVSRDTTNVFKATYWTNQMYVMSITNRIGVSFWNSYNAPYTNQSGSPITVYASDWLDMTLTNGANSWPTTAQFTLSDSRLIWPGSQWEGTVPTAKIGTYATDANTPFIATNWTYSYLPESIYRFNSANFDPVGSPTSPLWETTSPPLPPLPQFGLLTTNRLQAVILDGTHVIDYVQLRGPNNNRDLSAELKDPDYPDATGKYYQWSTNEVKLGVPPTRGVLNQIAVSKNVGLANGLSPNAWNQNRPPGFPSALGTTPPEEAAFFGGFYLPSFYFNGKTYVNMQTNVQAPYTPTRSIYDYTLWQANDPLVHYLASDLNYVDSGTVGLQKTDDGKNNPVPAPSQYSVGKRYQPWGRNKQMAGLTAPTIVDTNAYNLVYKDPLAWGSDNWNFPTNLYPTVGWLGRVHRGTPWQTVYLKAHNVLHNLVSGNVNSGTNTWTAWTGDVNVYDAANCAPLQDRLLFDLFTTRFNDNAARGTLSVNQTHLAAWSAVFSGLVALTNNASSPQTTPSYTSWIISPAGVDGTNAPLWQIVNHTTKGYLGIDEARAVFTNADGVVGGFEHVGDILSVPALTEQSPFLNWSDVTQSKNGISDELYEWLPQQTLGLLRCETAPRYVVYCYGQALRPAPNGVATSGGTFFGLVTNYQVVAESTARAVLRIDKTVTPSGVTNYSAVVESFNPLPPD